MSSVKLSCELPKYRPQRSRRLARAPTRPSRQHQHRLTFDLTARNAQKLSEFVPSMRGKKYAVPPVEESFEPHLLPLLCPHRTPPLTLPRRNLSTLHTSCRTWPFERSTRRPNLRGGTGVLELSCSEVMVGKDEEEKPPTTRITTTSTISNLPTTKSTCRWSKTHRFPLHRFLHSVCRHPIVHYDRPSRCTIVDSSLLRSPSRRCKF